MMTQPRSAWSPYTVNMSSFLSQMYPGGRIGWQTSTKALVKSSDDGLTGEEWTETIGCFQPLTEEDVTEIDKIDSKKKESSAQQEESKFTTHQGDIEWIDGAEPDVQKFNENHGSDGKFAPGGGSSGASGGGATDPSGTLDKADLSHVSGAGPIDGKIEHTVSLSLDNGAGDNASMSFTDQWVPGDVQDMLNSDHMYVFHGSDSAIEDVNIEVGDHPGGTYTSDTGKYTLFTNHE